MRKIRTLTLPGYVTGVSAIWILVAMLYSLPWSKYFAEPVVNLARPIAIIILGAVIGFTLLGGRIGNGRADRQRLQVALSSGTTLTPLYRYLFCAWLALALIEIVVEGTPPLLRAMLGQHSNYLFYGVPSLHGLLLAIACALALVEQAVRLNQGKLPFGPYTIVIFLWLLIVIARKHMIIVALQLVLLLLARGVVKLSVASMVRWGSAIVLCVFAFGLLGDLRSTSGIGIKEKLAYVGPPSIPDAIVWFYSYLTTPVANLQNAYALGYGGNGIVPWGAFSGLVPTVLAGGQQDLEGANEFATYPWLLTNSFNVSTGYIQPLVEAGLIGIFFFSVIIGLTSALLLSGARGVGGGLAYIVAYQCTLMMVFGNNFGNLNTVVQIPFLLILGARIVTSGGTRGSETSRERHRPATNMSAATGHRDRSVTLGRRSETVPPRSSQL